MKSFIRIITIATLATHCGIKANQQPLQNALQEGSYWQIKKAVEQGASVTTPLDDTGTTPLLQAIETQNSKIVLYLLDHGAASTLNTPDETGLHPLMKAIFFLDESTIRTMLQRGAIQSINAVTHGETALSFAIRSQAINLVRLLLEYGAAQSVTIPNEKNETPLLLAVQANDTKLVKLLLEYGAEKSISVASDKHQTPLSTACESDKYRMRTRFDKGDHPNIAMAQLLLQHGAAQSFNPSNKLEDPIVVAVDSDDMKLVQLLWEYGAADYIAKNATSSDILTCAIKKENMNMLHFLCGHGALKLLNELDLYHMTPLAVTILFNNIAMMRYILEQGATASLQRVCKYMEIIGDNHTVKSCGALEFVQLLIKVKLLKEEDTPDTIALLTEWQAKAQSTEKFATTDQVAK
jgi:ankyrin repeat protein